jgi:hypothetical protein
VRQVEVARDRDEVALRSREAPVPTWPAGAQAASVLELQRTVGNAALTRRLEAGRGPAGRQVLARDHHPPADAHDIAAYDATRHRHDANRARVQGWLDAGAAQNHDRMLRNSCEWAKTGRSKIYVLTKTHDSTARCAAAHHAGGAAWFSYPAGELSAATVYYTRRAAAADPWDNANIYFENDPDVDGFNYSDTRVVALMETAVARGSGYFYRVLKHETQHAADLHGNTDLERYKSEFRAYWLGSGEFNSESPTAHVHHLGWTWTARQWAIFDDMYNDPTYGYVKTAWDAENAEHDRTKRSFQNDVIAFARPESINPENSIRVDDFHQAVQAASHADCAADSAAHPNAKVTAVRTALAALDAADRADIKASAAFDATLAAQLSGAVLTDVRAALAR